MHELFAFASATELRIFESERVYISRENRNQILLAAKMCFVNVFFGRVKFLDVSELQFNFC